MNDLWQTLRFIFMALPALMIAMIPWLFVALPCRMMLQQFENTEGDNDIAMILSLGIAGVCYLAIPPYAAFAKVCMASASWLATGDWNYTPAKTQRSFPTSKIIGCVLLTVTWAALISFGYWLESLDWPNFILALVAVPFVWSGYIASFMILERYF
ncbi:MAG: hypothetical protein P8O79_02080 [Halieaceae bacterium]|nr:hypothetical protein [Halieaceae bacterium]